MSTGQYLHLHRSNPPESEFLTEYRVHAPDGSCLGFVGSYLARYEGGTRIFTVWEARDENGSTLSDDLESRYRAIEWVSER